MSGKYNSYELGATVWHEGKVSNKKKVEIFVDDKKFFVIVPAGLTNYEETLVAAKAEYAAGRAVEGK